MSANAQKLSVSLHPTDLDVIKTIRARIVAEGRFLTTSQAIKLALRTCELTDARLLLAILSQIEDNRKT